MSHTNYPFAENLISYNNEPVIEKFLKRSGSIAFQTSNEVKTSLALSGKLGGKIKLSLGVIYFVSLVYFTMKLLF